MEKRIKETTWPLVGAMSVLALAGSAQAASFDCAKASTKVEHIICDNPEISKLDDELGPAYDAALRNNKDPASVKALHKKWLASRNGCADADCVLQHYKAWLPALNGLGHNIAAVKAQGQSGREVYRYDFYKEQYAPGAADIDEEPSGEELAARPFCEAVIATLNKTKPMEDRSPCISEEVLKMRGVSDPPWKKLDLSQHEALAKKVLELRSVPMQIAYPKDKPTDDQLQRELERMKKLGAEMFALKIAPELFGDRILITLRYKDQSCGTPPQVRGERSINAWVTADMTSIATGPVIFQPEAARPILYYGKLYLLEQTADGLNVFVPIHERQMKVCTIEMSAR